MTKYQFIAVEGNIGSGKTTLAGMLAKHFGADLLLEQFEDNEFLPKFYNDPNRFAFPLEISFLAERYQQLKGLVNGSDLFFGTTVSDYYLSKSLIFAKTNLQDDEYRLFWQLFHIMFQTIPRPDLLIYLYRPVEQLKKNIAKRGRSYEQEIEATYLEKIQAQYIDFLRQHTSQLTVLIIDAGDIDFLTDVISFQKIIQLLDVQHHEGIKYAFL